MIFLLSSALIASTPPNFVAETKTDLINNSVSIPVSLEHPIELDAENLGQPLQINNPDFSSHPELSRKKQITYLTTIARQGRQHQFQFSSDSNSFIYF